MCSVGIMEPEGILKGSNRNERSTNTTTMTGKSPAVQSSHQGCMSSFSRDSWMSVSTLSMPILDNSARRWAVSVSSCAAAFCRCGKNTKRSASQ